MKAIVSDNPHGRDHNIINVPTRMHAILCQTEPFQWEFLFDQFRLNLQSRIAGADSPSLLKLQGNIEYMNEIEKLFKEIVGTP